MDMPHQRTTIVLFALLCLMPLQTIDAQMASLVFKRARECLSKTGSVLCLKEQVLDVLNQTVMSDKPMTFMNMINVEKDPNYIPDTSDDQLPADEDERSSKINALLYNKVEEFFESRMVKFSLSNVIEGRKKKDKTGMLLMMGGMAMAGMMGQMFLGKIAFMAGAALLVAKMALMMSTISALKKGGGGGGGGESSHIIYSSEGGHGGGGGGGGGWHRSLSSPEAHGMAYSNYVPQDTSSNYGY